MNEDLKTILQVVGGLAFVLATPIAGYLLTRKMQKQHADLPNMSVDALRSLATQQPVMHCHKVIEELKSRDEDISFAIPVLFKLAIQRSPAAYIIGWGVLKNHFADVLPDLDLSKPKPGPEERNVMQSKLNKLEKPTST
jgi:uncharacterized protein YneF (UPF0154 family)